MGEGIAERAAAWWAEQMEDAHADKREAFRSALAPILAAVLESEGDGLESLGRARDERVALGYVDYDPDEPLLRAIHAVDIECAGNFFSADGIFRCRKTGMMVRDGVLCAKIGRGADWVPVPEATSR